MTNKELWEDYKKNNTEYSKKKLIITYSNLVHYVINHSKFALQGILDERDFFEYGMQGLKEAIERYNPEFEHEQKFETFAIQRIRGAIIDGIRKYQEEKKNRTENCGNCYECLKDKKEESGLPTVLTRMILCPICGNKRCPKATNHKLGCTNSNETGQAGSRY